MRGLRYHNHLHYHHYHNHHYHNHHNNNDHNNDHNNYNHIYHYNSNHYNCYLGSLIKWKIYNTYVSLLDSFTVVEFILNKRHSEKNPNIDAQSAKKCINIDKSQFQFSFSHQSAVYGGGIYFLVHSTNAYNM